MNKFRAKVKEGYSGSFMGTKAGEWAYFKLKDLASGGIDDGLNCLVDETITRYTGLKDKNGDEIYSGDVVERDESDRFYYSEPSIGLVEYKDDGFYIEAIKLGKWQVVEKDNKTERSFYDHHGQNFSWENLEIIGNKFENPDLIK